MKKSLLWIICTFFSASSFAQLNFGIANSNYSGTQGMYMNPANIADSRNKWAFDFYFNNAYANNSEQKFDFKELYKDARNDDTVKLGNYFKSISSKNVDMILPFAEVKGPSLFYSINRKHSIGLSTRIRLMNQFDSFDGSFFNALAKGLSNTGSTFTVSDGDKYKWNSHAFSDIGLTYGFVIADKGKNFFKGGVTLKFYRGSAFIHLDGRQLNGSYYQQGDSLNIDDVDFTLTSNLDNERANQLDEFGDVDNFYDEFFGKSAANGFGGDVGFVYEYRPDYEKYVYDMDNEKNVYDQSVNKYKFKISLSMLDAGQIKYKDVDRIVVTGTGIIGSIENFDFNNFNEFKGEVTAAGFNVASSKQDVTMKLPTTFLFGFDYKFANRFYANTTVMQGAYTDLDSPGNFYYTQASFIPRYESPLIDVGVPVSYNNLSNDVKVGMGVRVAFFTVGTDDILGAFGTNSRGFNLYFGVRAAINHKKPKDSDGDLVSDKLDSCKFEKGVWEYKGCPIPDTDGDGVLDKEDLCPTVAGSKTAQGCPDQDADGIADASDLCPDVAGLKEFNGCPDTDNDSVPDKDDLCPNLKGEVRYAGCPDTDGDGISDDKDKCPSAAGNIANEGCPDTDGDGVHDGIDKCPSRPGPAGNSGCPVVSVEVKKRLAFAATAIQFDFGKATIKKNSYKLLDEIVVILNEYSDYYMTIEGHTDNVGSDDFNLQLSKDRAESVRQYFISKNINAERLTSDGFGETKPVATNKTSAGRAKNRRVDMDLKLK